jgi:hypothetical protein
MEHGPDDGGFGHGMSDQERQALATLESALNRRGRSVRALWAWLRFRLLVAWGPRLALAGGLVLALGGLAITLTQMSTDIWRAFGGELVLTAGGLLIGKAIQLRWYQAHPEHALRRRR